MVVGKTASPRATSGILLLCLNGSGLCLLVFCLPLSILFFTPLGRAFLEVSSGLFHLCLQVLLSTGNKNVDHLRISVLLTYVVQHTKRSKPIIVKINQSSQIFKDGMDVFDVSIVVCCFRMSVFVVQRE